MPAVFDKMGIRFLYPENWTLDEQEALDGNRAVTVYSPGGAFWSIALHPTSTDPDELAAAAAEILRAEYDDAESEKVSEEIGGVPMSGFDVNFFYFDLTNTALIRGFRTATDSCLVLCQAEDREFGQLAPVFCAITTSLLTNKQAS